jgi:large conductance mechanosensitive channel
MEAVLFTRMMRSFVQFIREQGVVGFATGFILGGAMSDLVKAFNADLVSPAVGLALGSAQGLKAKSFEILGANFAWGDFVTVFINFVVLSLVVYFIFRILPLSRLDKPKEK